MKRFFRHAPFSLLAATLLAATACSGGPELEFADWVFPVPEGTPVHEYAPVPLEGRDPQAVQLIEDLVIGDDPQNPEAALYRPFNVVASEAGDIFVGDFGANDIKMYGPDGRFIKTLGKEGQGPGEFGGFAGMTIAGDHLVVSDIRNRRFSVWTLEGEHVADHGLMGRTFLSSMHGLADGTLIGYFTERDEDRVGRRIVARWSAEGEEIARLLESPPIPPPTPISREDPATMMRMMIHSMNEQVLLRVDIGAREIAYVTPLTEYQVTAMSPEGEALWAMRVAWEPLPYADAQKRALIDSLSENFPVDEPVDADDFDWPERNPALTIISTDGAGRLFVIPGVEYTGSGRRDEWPVDVYSPNGDFIAAGVVPSIWSYAVGEYVYATRPNEEEEIEVVRYRLSVDGDR